MIAEFVEKFYYLSSSLIFSMTDRPAGSGIDITQGGIISGTPTQPDVDASPISLTVIATDPDLESESSNVFNLTVADANDAPLLSSPIVDFTVVQSAPFSRDLSTSFSDPDGDGLTFAVSGLPANLALYKVDGGGYSELPASL
jgi:hypothetical protein